METGRTVGRPTDYSLAVAELICERLSTTKLGLERICDDEDMPSKSAVWRWLAKFPEFRELYARAREFQTEVMYDDLMVIPNLPLTHNGETVEDGGIMLEGPAIIAEVQRRKLLCDNLKFILAKLQPKRFGERKDVNVDIKTSMQVSAKQFSELLVAAKAAPQIAAEDAEYEMLPQVALPEAGVLKSEESEDPDWL